MANDLPRDVSGQPITQGILDALRGEFGDGYAYYVNQVPQNYQTPSFYIRQVSGSFELIRWPRYLRRHLYMVTYFPPERNRHKEEDMQAVLCRMYPVLEFIGKDGQLIRGTSMSHTVDKDALHVEIHYDFFVFRYLTPAPKMEVLVQNQHVKE